MVKSFFDDEDEPLTPKLAPLYSASKIRANNKIKKTILIILTVVICAIAVTYFFFKVVRTSKSYKGQNTTQSVTSSSKEEIKNSYLNLDPIIVNLLSSSGKQNYAKLTLTLQLSSDQEIKKIEAKLPIIIDTIENFLRELRVEDFNGSGNTFLLKEEFLKRINRITYPLVIDDVLFKEVVVN